MTASIACDAAGLDVKVLFHAVDSQYVDGAESVLDRGGGRYMATWPISAINRRVNGTYALVVIATNSDGGSSVDRSASVTLSNVTRRPAGERCSTPEECVSGFCVGSVCCTASCSGACMTCAAHETEIVTHATGGSLDRLGLAFTEIDELRALARPLRMRLYNDLDGDGLVDDSDPLLGEVPEPRPGPWSDGCGLRVRAKWISSKVRRSNRPTRRRLDRWTHACEWSGV